MAGGFPFAGYLASGPMEMWAGPRAVAKGFVELTQESRIQTVSALDLCKMSSLEGAVEKLADGILALKDPADIEKIRTILTKCERFAQYFPSDYHSGLVDLLDLSRKLAADEELTSRSPGIRDGAIEIFRILDEEGGIIAQRNSKDQVFRREWWRKDDGKYFFDVTTKDFVPEEKVKEKPDAYRLWLETGASSVSGSEWEKATRFAFKRSSLWSSTQAGGLSVYLPHKKEDLDSAYTQEGNPNPLNLAFVEKTGWDKVVRLLAS
ncbi:MAG: hypothetical protein HYU64_04500 [Armatimonadetes bacterium]|nr:hypothetical protein [Armatimonadota bacterium]